MAKNIKLPNGDTALVITEIDKVGEALPALAGPFQTQTAIALGATAVRKTFNPPIRGVIIEVVGGNGTPDQDEAAIICFGAPTTVAAGIWLNEANTAPRIVMKPGDGIREWSFGNVAISYIDLIAKGTTPDLDVTLTGVE